MERRVPKALEIVADFIEDGIPFNRFLGLKVVRLLEGECLLHLPWADHFIGDVMRPALHGGVTSTLIDVAGGAACFTMVDLTRDRLSTVDLRVDYLLPGPAADLYVEAKVIRMGNRVATVTMEVHSGSFPSEGPIAIGRGVYNVKRQA